jgi:hypothetical protein
MFDKEIVFACALLHPKIHANVLSSYIGKNLLLIPDLCLVPWHDFLNVGSEKSIDDPNFVSDTLA